MASTWQCVVVTGPLRGSMWRLLESGGEISKCCVSYVAVTRIPSLVLHNTWHYVIIRYSYGELPKFVLRCSYEAALRKGVTTALESLDCLCSVLYRLAWYFWSKVQVTKARLMKTLVLVAHAMRPCLQWLKIYGGASAPVSGCRDYRLARQALNHSSFRAFCFHRSKVLLTGRYVGPPQPV